MELLTLRLVTCVPRSGSKQKYSTLLEYFCLERLRGIEPLSRPWQGRIIPLYYSRVRVLYLILLNLQNYGAGPQSRTGHACLFRAALYR